MTIEIVIRDADDLEALRERLKDFEPVLQAMGAVLVSRGQEAFAREAFDDVPWPRRYPAQKGAPLNVAGLISDLNAGKDPPLRRFEDRPAGIDTGTLLGSFYSEVLSPLSVEAGPHRGYAQGFHSGGPFSMPVLPETVTRLRDFVRQHPQYEQHLARFIGEDPDEEYASRFARRPLMGITEQDRVDFIGIVEAYLGGEA